MFELHQILEDGIAENTARMLRLTSGKRSTSLVEVYCDESGVAGVTALLSDLHSVCMFKEVHYNVAFVTGHLPFWSGGEI